MGRDAAHEDDEDWKRKRHCFKRVPTRNGDADALMYLDSASRFQNINVLGFKPADVRYGEASNLRSYGNFVQTRAEASSLLECYAECSRCSSNFVQTSAESSSLLECYAECSRNSSKKTKASRKTQRLCMGEYMMAPASPLRVGTRLKQGWCYCQCMVSWQRNTGMADRGVKRVLL